MRKVLSLFFVFSFLFLNTSCSTDHDDSIIDNTSYIVGVWEQDGFLDNSGQRLVFAANYNALKIFRSTEGELVNSSISAYLWKLDGDTVIVYEGENDIISTYLLHTDGQIVSNDMNELPFNKISDSTLDYF